MIRLSTSALALLALCAAIPALAGGTLVRYSLYHFEASSWKAYYPGDALPAGGNLPGSNRWRYDYSLFNLSAPGAVNTLVVFFNSDGTLRAQPGPASVSSPPGWASTFFAPPAGSQAWRQRFRNLSTPLGVGGQMAPYTVEFFWGDPTLPGPQPYDAGFAAGSETGRTLPLARPSPVIAVSWGHLRRAFAR